MPILYAVSMLPVFLRVYARDVVRRWLPAPLATTPFLSTPLLVHQLAGVVGTADRSLSDTRELEFRNGGLRIGSQRWAVAAWHFLLGLGPETGRCLLRHRRLPLSTYLGTDTTRMGARSTPQIGTV